MTNNSKKRKIIFLKMLCLKTNKSSDKPKFLTLIMKFPVAREGCRTKWSATAPELVNVIT